MILIFLGPPGAGKGTYSSLLSDRMQIPHISTGDILREAIEKETHLGKMAKLHVDKGEFVSDDVMIGLLAERITRFDAHKGFILDGFPRTKVQAEKLDELLSILLRKIDFIFDIDVSEEEIISRLSQRRVCTNCSAIYHMKRNPPRVPGICDICGGSVIQRPDDEPETVRKRIVLYKKKSLPVVEYYKDHNGYRLIDGVKTDIYGLEKLMNGN